MVVRRAGGAVVRVRFTASRHAHMDKSEKEGKQRDPLDFMPHHLRDTFINGTTEEAARAISELEQWSRVTGSNGRLETVGMLSAKRD